MKPVSYDKYVSSISKWIKDVFLRHFSFNTPLLGGEKSGMEQLLCAFSTRKGVKHHIIRLFRRNMWLCLIAIIILMFAITIGVHYLKTKKYEGFGSYANAKMQGAIDILSINTLEPIYRIGLIRDMYLFENPAFRDAIEKQSTPDANLDNIVNELINIIKSDLNRMGDVGSECPECEKKLRDALDTLSSSRISADYKLDVLKNMSIYDPAAFTKIMDISNYTNDKNRQKQLMDLIGFLRLNVPDPILNIPESFTPIQVSARPPYTTKNFEAACEIIKNNSISASDKIRIVKDINIFENPGFRSKIMDTETIDGNTVNNLNGDISNDISQAVDEFSRLKMSQASKMLYSGSLLPEQKVRILNTMDVYNPADYIYITNNANYSNNSEGQVYDLTAYINCGDVEQKRRVDEAAAAAQKALEDAAALAQKAADEAAALAQKTADEALEAAKKAQEFADESTRIAAEQATKAADDAKKIANDTANKAKKASKKANPKNW